jgi:hypothetical protein
MRLYNPGIPFLFEAIVRKRVLLLAFIFVLSSFAPLRSAAAETPGNSGRDNDPQFQRRRNERDDTFEKMEKERAKRINKERHERIQRDTDKLLALATELKEYVDKSNEHILSIDVIRKAEEIEKLAHQVREKMKSEP